MRIKTIELAWFRGAADPVSLPSGCKSMVIYGENGAGKSCFVDAIEYVINNGKIRHLVHEYSGKHQEKGIPNTHKPEHQETELKFIFKDDSEIAVHIKSDGFSTISDPKNIAMGTWDYGRIVLRQNEVADFINNTKGVKYSALLPLLGLHQMEVAAENLRQLSKSVERQSEIKELKYALLQLEKRRTEMFGNVNNQHISKKIAELYSKYFGDEKDITDVSSQCNDLISELSRRVGCFSSDQKSYLILKSISELDLKDRADSIRVANAKLAEAMEPLISEKIEILLSAETFAQKIENVEEIECPACGQIVPFDRFQTHISTERERLKKITDIFEARRTDMGTLFDGIKSLKVNVDKVDVKTWKDELRDRGLNDSFNLLAEVNAEDIRISCGEKELDVVKRHFCPIIEAAVAASKYAPHDVREVSNDKETVEVAKSVFQASELVSSVERASALIAFINSLEHNVRQEIKLRAKKVIDEISADVRDMWAILHPQEPIKDIYLYLPADTDKAIDIGLTFHEVKQNSPRLTLSEGHRNSLGLCIFLAMARQEENIERPLILDDVVVSFDRNHRGMIVAVLEKYFSGRQILLFTHDRDWYAELRLQLEAKAWDFKSLLPYETPSIGIRWSHKTTTFDDARAQLKDRPDSAGNDARKIMDIELALIAEKLQISIPFMRSNNNDKRNAHDFLTRLVGDGYKCFEIRDGDKYMVNVDAIGVLDKADRLLISWANRGSHTFDLVRPEAVKLIEICEKALELFRCPSCGKAVWFADAKGAESVQCQCGQIRWRYKKG